MRFWLLCKVVYMVFGEAMRFELHSQETLAKYCEGIGEGSGKTGDKRVTKKAAALKDGERIKAVHHRVS
jgi:hypothetical protein